MRAAVVVPHGAAGRRAARSGLTHDWSLVGGDWSGAASQSFQELYSQWDQSAIQLKESLQGISELLSQAALSYEESENSISGTFRG